MIPSNYLKIHCSFLFFQFVAVDAGSRISFGSESDKAPYDLPFGVRISLFPHNALPFSVTPSTDVAFCFFQSRTRALDCIRHYIVEAVEFIKDWNFTARSSKVRASL